MPSTEYREIRSAYRAAIRRLVREDPSVRAALPAYAHANPLVGHIFWKRIRVVSDMALAESPKWALDFGCGVAISGVLLARAGVDVTAVDLDLDPQRRLALRREPDHQPAPRSRAPAPTSWPLEWKAAFDRICGEEMAACGYGS